MLRVSNENKGLRDWQPMRYLEGHCFAFGRIGGGKSVGLKSLCETYHDLHNYKIWDLYGGDRNEGIFWTIPSQQEKYWKTFYALGTPSEEGPKQYKVNLLYPYFESKLPKKLPKKDNYVRSILFTIPLKDVGLDDIRVVLGNLPETTKFQWNEIQHMAKKTSNAGDLLDFAKKLKATSTTLYKNFILPMSREKFLMHSNCVHNLDIIKEAKDQEAITVLCLDFVPKEFHLLVINYILRKMKEHVEVNKIPKKNINFIREASTFFRAVDAEIVEDRFKIFKALLTNYMRMGRSGMYFFCDCQSSSEVRGVLQGSEDLLLMFRMTSWRDKQDLTDELKREKRMLPAEVADLALLDKGQCYVAEVGKNVKKVQLSLPRTMFWKKEHANFYRSLWDRFDGSWVETSTIKEEIKAACYREPERKIKKVEPIPIPVASSIDNTRLATEEELMALL